MTGSVHLKHRYGTLLCIFICVVFLLYGFSPITGGFWNVSPAIVEGLLYVVLYFTEDSFVSFMSAQIVSHVVFVSNILT